MRIVLAVHQFVPDYTAGTEILTYSVAKELQKRGHRVEVWTGFPADRHLWGEGRFDRYEFQGVPVQRYHHSFATTAQEQNVIESEYYNRFFKGRFSDYVIREKPGIVHFFHLGRLSASPIEACCERGIPTVFTATDFWFMCPTSQLRLPDNSLCLGPDGSGVNCLQHVVATTQPDRIRELVRLAPSWALRLMIRGSQQSWWPEKTYSPLVSALAQRPVRLVNLFNRVDRILAPTALMWRFMVAHGIDEKRIRLAPYGVNFARTRRTAPNRTRNPLRIGFIGTLGEHKGAHLLVRAFQAVPRDKGLVLRIYGRLDEFPDYGTSLKALASGDHRIEFCGTFPNRKVGEVMAGLDVLVVPSIWYENTPLVVYSAQAAGTPVVASNVGGLSEVIQDGENGLLFQMGDVPGLTAALARLVDEKGLVRKLAKKAVKPRSVSEYVDQLEETYGEISSRNRRRR
ncbi:MAG: glycosyltransferase family 4 protein [Anaerolineales bacterium]